MKNEMLIDGKIEKLWGLLVRLHETQPVVFSNPRILRDYVAMSWTDLDEKKRCPNCKASMVSYRFEFDMMDVALLIAMASTVRMNMKAGKTFTESNSVHVQKLNGVTYAMKSRTTQMSKLGLIAKSTRNGKQIPGVWVITQRGFDALANKPVPKWVETHRNKITERADKEIATTTILNITNEYNEKMVHLMLKGKDKKITDHTPFIEEYNRHNDWIHFAGVIDGAML